jgi:hypothetical protein
MGHGQLVRHIALTTQRIPGTLGVFAAALRWHGTQIALYYAQEQVTRVDIAPFCCGRFAEHQPIRGCTHVFCQKVLAIVCRSTGGGVCTRSCA